MTFICLWTPTALPAFGMIAPQESDEILRRIIPSLLGVAPRVKLGARGIVWADARGMNSEALARDLLAVFHQKGVEKVRAGLSIAPVSAEVAARYGNGALIAIPAGSERDYLAAFPVGVLEPSLALSTLLDGIGVESCADLARLDLGVASLDDLQQPVDGGALRAVVGGSEGQAGQQSSTFLPDCFLLLQTLSFTRAVPFI